MVLPEFAQLYTAFFFFFPFGLLAEGGKDSGGGRGGTQFQMHIQYILYFDKSLAWKIARCFLSSSVSTLTKLHYNHIFQFLS